MKKNVTTIQLCKDTYDKLSSYRRKLSAKLEKDMTFDEVINSMILELGQN